MKGSIRSLYYSIYNIRYSRSAVLLILVILIWPNLTLSSEIMRTTNDTAEISSRKPKLTPKESVDTPLFSTGNNLWDTLIRDCLRKPSLMCIQRNVYAYLSDTLKLSSLNITNTIQFNRNAVDYDKLSKLSNSNEIDQDYIEDSPIEEISSAVSNKMTKFIMTHDLKMKMPQMVFDGAILKISPRSFEGNGMIAKLEFIPEEESNIAAPRIFFKKIKKHVQKKLLLALVGIILIVKIIKIKLFWFLPMLIGATAAKKLVLKVLLFLFPALSHIFKLCSYYHSSFHKTNYHHHLHSINHLHTVYPSVIDTPDTIYSHPPKAPPVPPHSSHDYHGPEWELSGPGLGSEFINDLQRVSYAEPFNPHLDDINEIKSWGLNGGPSIESPNHSHATNPLIQRYTVSKPYGKTSHFSSAFGPVHRVSTAESSIHSQVTKPKLEENFIKDSHRQELAQQKEYLRYQAEQKLISKQQQILNQQPFVHDSEVPHLVDPFYSPILSKVDKIFEAMRVDTEVCKEQIICKMYKNPIKFSPYSNYISTELSRDASELQKPTETNPAVIRFFKYIQAAREGQDQQDCALLYPSCS